MGGARRSRWLWGLLVCVAAPWAAAGSPPPWEVWSDLHRLAEVVPGDRVLLRSSFCPGGCRFDRHSPGDSRFVRRDGDEGVVFEEAGAGAITRVWMTTGDGTSDPLPAGVQLRVYLDGAAEPVIDLPLPALFDGSAPPFVPPLAGDRTLSSGGYFSYVPIAYRDGCRVTLTGADDVKLWFQFAFHRLADAEGVVSFTGGEDLSGLSALLSLRGQDPWQLAGGGQRGKVVTGSLVLAPGEEAEIASLDGPETITALLLRTAPERFSSLELALAFDGEERARLPLADFFAVGREGAGATRSLLVGLDADGDLYAYFPMPFRTSARVVLRSLLPPGGAAIEVDHFLRLAGRGPAPESGLFGARLSVSPATAPGEDFELLRLPGRGKWVGLWAELGSVASASRQYLEGDERLYLDGSPDPGVYGTGVEDLFGGGFYFDGGPFGLSLHGSPYHLTPGGEDVTAAYRLMLADGATFEGGLAAGLEGGPAGDLSMRARTVAYYYQRASPRLVLLDALDLGDPVSRLEHAYRVAEPVETLSLVAAFEGEPPREHVGRGLYRDAGAASFVLRAPSGAEGLRLRRRFDTGFGGQAAEVYVDGRLAGCLAPSAPNGRRRWKEVDLDLPAALAVAGGELEITVVPLPGQGEAPFSAFAYQLWGTVACDPCPLFADGFEAGDGLQWSRER